MKLTNLACDHSRRVLVVAGIVLVVALVVGAPIVTTLQASLSDFEDPGTQTARVTSLIRHRSR